MAVKANIIEGSSLEQSKGKISKTLVYLVTGVSGSTTFDKEAAGLAATPAMGATGPAGTSVVSKSAKIEGPAEVRVTVRYETGNGADLADPEDPTLPIYEVGTQLQQETTKWLPATSPTADREKILIDYKGEQKAGSMVIDQSLYTVRITRVEVGVDPGLIAKTVVNKINSHTWLNGEPDSWRCINIQGQSSDGGTTWTMVYEFLYIETGHQPIAVLIDKETGEMYDDATYKPEKGAKKIEYYKKFDFRTLGF